MGVPVLPVGAILGPKGQMIEPGDRLFPDVWAAPKKRATSFREATYVAGSGNTDAEAAERSRDPLSGAVRPPPEAFPKMSAPLTGITLGAP